MAAQFRDGSVQTAATAGKTRIRLTDYSASLSHIRLLKASCIGKLVSLKGTVVRMSSVKPLVQQMDFVCSKCGTTIACNFLDGKYTPPAGCLTDGCKSRQFLPIRSSAQCTDWQKIRLQVNFPNHMKAKREPCCAAHVSIEPGAHAGDGQD